MNGQASPGATAGATAHESSTLPTDAASTSMHLAPAIPASQQQSTTASNLSNGAEQVSEVGPTNTNGSDVVQTLEAADAFSKQPGADAYHQPTIYSPHLSTANVGGHPSQQMYPGSEDQAGSNYFTIQPSNSTGELTENGSRSYIDNSASYATTRSNPLEYAHDYSVDTVYQQHPQQPRVYSAAQEAGYELPGIYPPQPWSNASNHFGMPHQQSPHLDGSPNPPLHTAVPGNKVHPVVDPSSSFANTPISHGFPTPPLPGHVSSQSPYLLAGPSAQSPTIPASFESADRHQQPQHHQLQQPASLVALGKRRREDGDVDDYIKRSSPGGLDGLQDGRLHPFYGHGLPFSDPQRQTYPYNSPTHPDSRMISQPDPDFNAPVPPDALYAHHMKKYQNLTREQAHNLEVSHAVAKQRYHEEMRRYVQTDECRRYLAYLMEYSRRTGHPYVNPYAEYMSAGDHQYADNGIWQPYGHPPSGSHQAYPGESQYNMLDRSDVSTHMGPPPYRSSYHPNAPVHPGGHAQSHRVPSGMTSVYGGGVRYPQTSEAGSSPATPIGKVCPPSSPPKRTTALSSAMPADQTAGTSMARNRPAASSTSQAATQFYLNNPDFNQPNHSHRKKPKPDPNAPVKPFSAYVKFGRDLRHQLQDTNKSFSDISKIIGIEWRNLPAKTKEELIDQAEEAKTRYQAVLKAYKTTKEYKEYQAYLADFKAHKARQQ